MSPFWTGLFENLRGRGKHPTLFLVALPAVLAGAFVAAKIPEAIYRHRILPALPWVGLIGIIWFARAILKARARRRERLPRGRLSEDEVRKARAKLANNRLRRQNSLVPPA